MLGTETMSINWKWNAPIRPMFRIAAGLLGVVLAAFGGLLLFLRYRESLSFTFDSSARGEVAMLGWGIIFLIVAIRGRLIKRDIG